MNIGIISSGNESIFLFKYLNHYKHNYTIYYDQNNNFLGDKDFDYACEQILSGIKQLKKQNCEKIIIDPLFEIFFLQEKIYTKYQSLILPIFTHYLHDYIFKYSLIGKIGICGDFASIQKAQAIISNEAKKYSLTEHQKKIKKFHIPFKYRVKETRMWKYFLNNLSFSNYMVNKVIKFDLRYFKNANVDTIIPLNYGYFNYQRTISNYFNFNKQRFHNSKAIETILTDLLTEKQDNKYTIQILTNGHTQFLQDNKHLLRLLQKGKSATINFIEKK